MKVFLPARHGLGNVLEWYFTQDRGNLLLSKLREAYLRGEVTEVLAFYEQFMNPVIADVFTGLDFPVRAISTSNYPGVISADGGNKFDDKVGEYYNLLTNAPPVVTSMPDDVDRVTLPISKARHGLIPAKFVLFNGHAGEKERYLTDPDILTYIKRFTDLPIVSVGKGINRNDNLVCPLRGDVPLEGVLSITDIFGLMKDAELIVSSLSYMRIAAKLFQKTVIELAQHPSKNTIDRTEMEYSGGSYGTTQGLSFWYKWPEEKAKFQERVKCVLT